MLTFHGDPKIKEQRIEQVRAHRLADQLIHRKYWEDGKGCAVGCTVHSGEHIAYETELGIPVELAYIEDHIFETLPNGTALMWPERFLQAIPVGVDLRSTHINKRFVLALFADEKRGAIQRESDPKIKSQVELIAENLRQGVDGDPKAEAAAKDRAYLAYRADLAYLAYRAYRADLADLAYRAYRAYRADLADLAGSASADLAEILLEVLAASAPSTSLRTVAEVA